MGAPVKGRLPEPELAVPGPAGAEADTSEAGAGPRRSNASSAYAKEGGEVGVQAGHLALISDVDAWTAPNHGDTES